MREEQQDELFDRNRPFRRRQTQQHRQAGGQQHGLQHAYGQKAGLLCAVPGSAVNNQAHGAEHTGICKHEKHLTHRVIVSPDTALHTAHQPVRLRRTCKLINADGQHIAHHHQRRAGSPWQQHRKKHQRQQYTPCAVTQAQKAQRTCCALVGKAARQL